MAKFKIPWLRFALVLIPVIAINVFLVRKIFPKKEPEKIELKVLPDKDPLPPAPPMHPTPDISTPAATVQAVKAIPWDHSRPLALPPKLAARFAGNGKNKRVMSGIVVDLNSRRALWARNSRTPVAVASLTKLMTAFLAAERMESDPGFQWTTILRASANVPRVERSSVLGIKAGETYAVGELMQSMMINSHNDSAYMLAESIGGTTENFVAMMNSRGRELGLTSVNFNSPNGYPQGKKRVNSFASAEDIVHICEWILRYPKVLGLCTMTSAKLHNGLTARSHNNLLLPRDKAHPWRKKVPGMIGFKTGYTATAGFCLAFGVSREGRTILGCVTGFGSARERDEFCMEVIEWAFRQKP